MTADWTASNPFLFSQMHRPPLILAALFLGVACSAGGPPYPAAAADKEAAQKSLTAAESEGRELSIIEGYYRFAPAVSLFGDPQLGEVFLRRTRGRIVKWIFYMRILGRDSEGSIRIRQYEGDAVLTASNQVELRSERCYLFGKKNWDDRLAPIQRWTCDHLYFLYESDSNFARREMLRPVNGPRQDGVEWFQATPLEPLPLNSAGNSEDGPHFAGQIFPLTAEESASLPDNADIVVWGYNAGRLLRNGQVLRVQVRPRHYGTNISVQDSSRNQSAVLDGGELRIVSRPGDFILCRWLRRPPAGFAGTGQTGGVPGIVLDAGQTSIDAAAVAWTQDSLLNQGGGLFE